MAVKPGRCVGFDPVQHKASPPPGLIFSTAITIFPLRHSRYLTDPEVRGHGGFEVGSREGLTVGQEVVRVGRHQVVWVQTPGLYQPMLESPCLTIIR